MADVEFTRTETLTREETAKLLATLAEALSAGNGRAKLSLGDTRIELHVPERLQTEVEVEVDGDEVELEIWGEDEGGKKTTVGTATVEMRG